MRLSGGGRTSRISPPAWAAELGPGDLPARWRPGDEPGTVVLRCGALPRELEAAEAVSGHWLIFRRPARVLEARSAREVRRLLREAETEVARGLVAAGFLAYEAAPGLDPALAARPAGEIPGPEDAPLLAWFGVYPEVLASVDLPAASCGSYRLGAWRDEAEVDSYAGPIARIREWIAAGHVYQVNYTRRLRASFRGDPFALFRALIRAQPSAHAAFVHAGPQVICSASPELLLRLRGEEATTRPMKGTRRRGPTASEDAALAADLVGSPKDRAENVMIVDLARNDLGRIARTGSVEVVELCALERYPTVWQLVSTVRARTEASLPDCLAALFPAASITGAPKVRATEIIAEAEANRRGAYTGSIGFWGPGPIAEFNVAIRTVSIDRASRTAEYGTGGGIVWDSRAEAEFAESTWKAAILTRPRPRFRLLETLLWTGGRGYVLLERHLGRLLDSAAYFGFAVDEEEVRRRLRRAGTRWTAAGQGLGRVVRLLADPTGSLRLEARPAPPPSARSWRLALAGRPVDPDDPFLYHKTTHRAVYVRAMRGRPGYDDVLLWNARGELTESTRANVAVELEGAWWTPPVSSGLLAGTQRAELLDRGVIRERVLRVEDLARATGIRLCNSVRGWIEVKLEP